MNIIFWAIIITWCLVQLVKVFRSAGASRKSREANNRHKQQSYHGEGSQKNKALRESLDNEGEYVEYEEIR